MRIVSGLVVFGIGWVGIGTGVIFAQQEAGQKLEFDVASVRPAAPPVPGTVTVMGIRGGPGSTDPTRMTGKIDLRNALLRAFGVQVDQLTGPDWMQNERYDFSANIPPGTTAEQFNVMLQNLLIDRFKITLHHEKKNFAVYDLLVAKGGLKMKPSTAEPNPLPGAGGPAQAGPAVLQAQAQAQLEQLMAQARGTGNKLESDGFPSMPEGNRPFLRGITSNGSELINARGQSMEGIVRALQGGLGRGVRVVDKTGLTGLYDFKLQYARQGNAALQPIAVVAGAGAPVQAQTPFDVTEPAPDVVTAAQSQLGLRLEKGTAPYDVIVIDHIEKTPVEN